MKDITQIMYDFYAKEHDHTQAERHFHEILKENDLMRESYQEWCDEMGYTERKGFRSFVMNIESDSIWDSIFPNKEELEGYEFFN